MARKSLTAGNINKELFILSAQVVGVWGRKGDIINGRYLLHAK